MSIRLATIADAPAIRACMLAAFEPFRAAYTAGAFDDTVPSVASIADRLATMVVYIKPDGDRCDGTLSWHASAGVAHLRGMAVRPDAQGGGVAAVLIARALADMRATGIGRVTLDTTAPLARARRFYARHGFRTTGRTTDFFGMPLTEMALDLVAHRGDATAFD